MRKRLNCMKIFQADIQNRGGMGQGTAGNVIHTQCCDGFDVFLCHVAGSFCFGSAVDDADGFCHFVGRHVIQHDDICTSFYSFLHHV